MKKNVPKNMIKESEFEDDKFDELAEKVGNINPTASNIARN